jgi:hypothetical protein
MQHDKSKAAWRGTLGNRWSAEDDALLLEARRLGFSWRDTGTLLGRTTIGESALRSRFELVQQRAEIAAYEKRRATRAKMRRCLCCTAEFLSAHAGNRLCDPCRVAAADSSTLAPATASAEGLGDDESDDMDPTGA